MSRYRATADGSHGINSSSHQKTQSRHPLLFQFFFYDSFGSDDLFHCLYGGIECSHFLSAAGDFYGGMRPDRVLP